MMCYKGERVNTGYSDMWVLLLMPIRGRMKELWRIKQWEWKLIIMNVWHFMSLCVIFASIKCISEKNLLTTSYFISLPFSSSHRKWVSDERIFTLKISFYFFVYLFFSSKEGKKMNEMKFLWEKRRKRII